MAHMSTGRRTEFVHIRPTSALKDFKPSVFVLEADGPSKILVRLRPLRVKLIGPPSACVLEADHSSEKKFVLVHLCPPSASVLDKKNTARSMLKSILHVRS